MARKIIEIDFEKLYEIACQRNEVDILVMNLFNLYLLNRNNYDIRRIFHNRRLLVSEKLELLKRLFGITASNLFYELMYLMLKHKLDHKIYYIFEGYSKVVEHKGNRIIVQVYTPIPLPIMLLQEIKQKLSIMLNKKVLLKNFIDSKLIGGMWFKLPNGKIYDFSYKKELENLRNYLMEKKIWK